MSEDESKIQGKKGWGCGHWLAIAVMVVIALGLVMPFFIRVSEKGTQMVASNNCRQVIICLKNWAADHGGKYPEGMTSNDAFREFFKDGQLDGGEGERIFTAQFSPYHGDNQIGEAPDYAEALKARENHWAMTKGLTDRDSGNAPLIFDNPAVKAWPPRWNAGEVETGKPGQVRKGSKVIIGRNDGSVAAEKVDASGGLMGLPPPQGDGKNIFEQAGPHEILDVAR